MTRPNQIKIIIFAGIFLVILGCGVGIRQALAIRVPSTQQETTPLHPVFAILDESGVNVLDSSKPVSTLKTCGQCHDADYITSHSFHSDLGFSEVQSGGMNTDGSWNVSSGNFGHWDPLTYRYLSQPGDENLDLGTPEWVMTYGLRHVGGGPATTAINGWSLTSLPVLLTDPATSYKNPDTGLVTGWDWDKSGVVEMNCFLCHIASPDNDARLKAIKSGRFGWANTATLAGTSLVTEAEDGTFDWNPDAFDENGELLEINVLVQDPNNENCATCHGLVHTSEEPLVVTGCSLENPLTATTGQVISAERINQSGVNLAGKTTLTRSWDIHAERQLECVDCHYSLNNPIYYLENSLTKPAHLLFDPRRIDFGEYLERPDHNLARGQSAQYNLDPNTEGSMRRCESCHDAERTHADWLPYTTQHMSVVSCESCHIPKLYAPAIETYDWTVLSIEGDPQVVCRGIEGEPGTVTSLVTGYEPALLRRNNIDGTKVIAPYNLITTWYWIYDDANGNTRPVPVSDLQAVYLQDGNYSPDIISAFDTNADGEITSTELVLDSPEKQALIVEKLKALGMESPRIQGTIQPYSINHGVVSGENAVSDCRVCHSDSSQVARPIRLSSFLPSDVIPQMASDTNITSSGKLSLDDSGALFFQVDTDAEDLHIFGYSRARWVDWIGGLTVLGVVAGITGHGLLRFINARKLKKIPAGIKRVYMYESYERFWHWLQTVLIVVLLLTGLFIHRPDLFGISFRGLVVVHNVSAAILAINAALSLFYHLVSGKVRQFIPRPYGFFDDAIKQTKYYLKGIFSNQAHPFEKTPEKKMNPLQQVTYLGILNVLLPLQGLTGILMWGAQRWPEFARVLGGLQGLASFHTLIAWIFAAFIIGHVYLTTTGGPRPLDSIKAMVTGWEEIEEHHAQDYSQPEVEKPAEQ